MLPSPLYDPAIPADTGAPAGAAKRRRLRLADTLLTLDEGGAHDIAWPDAASMAAQLAQRVMRREPVVRLAGGALIADLSLHDNLMLEPALRGAATPADLTAGLDALFDSAGCPARRASWRAVFPGQATELERLQARVGRAMMADPDVLVIDASGWDEPLLPRARFDRSFATQYPWRTLVWATVRACA